MQATATIDSEREPSGLETAGIWARHLLALVLPLSTLGFAVSGPNGPWAPLWLLPLVGSVVADWLSPAEKRQPLEKTPAWPFDALLFLLFGLQFVNVLLSLRMIAQAGFFSLDMLVGVALVGVNSGYSAIVVAHELIHRESVVLQTMGRLLLGTVLYEHFSVEHVRGHHSRVGTAEDPATARYGETFRQFARRTIPAQFRSAWRLEAKRLGDEDMSLLDARTLRNRVLHGIAGECALALAVLAVFGLAPFLFFLLQAGVAVLALEAVNYFEHYALRRGSRRVRPVDSWDTDSAFTYYTLVGLSRHADHHAYAWRPYQQLRVWEESPKLPAGYFGMVEMVWFRNARARELLETELRRRGLGPFADAAAS